MRYQRVGPIRSLYTNGYSQMAKLFQFPALPAETEKPANPKGKSALTELRIEKLPVTGATYYVQDGAQPGLSLRVSAGGVKAFIFTKHQHGRLTRITLGRVGAMRLDAARKAAQKLHGELAMGVDIGAAHKTKRNAPVEETMQQAFERFLTLKTRRASTTGDYQSIWRMHIPANLKRKAVKDVTAADIEDVKRTAGKKHRTANLIVVLIGAIMAKSGRWADNPARGIARHAEHPRTRRLSMDELQRVWAAASVADEGDRPPGLTVEARASDERLWSDFFRLLILTGARRSPFQAMRWQDLNLDAGVWIVSAEWSKNKHEMAVPLSAEATRILRERGERTRLAYSEGNSPWVWPSADSATGHVINPVKAWKRLLKAAGVHEHTTLHDVRRTLGSRLAMDGVAGATISKVLGHVSAQSLKHYLHLDVSAGSEAIDRLMAGVITSRSKQSS
jgi:integrase